MKDVIKLLVLSVIWACFLFCSGGEYRVMAAQEPYSGSVADKSVRVFFENPMSFYGYYCSVLSNCSNKNEQDYVRMEVAYSREEKSRDASILASVRIATHKVSLNAYEMELFFDPQTQTIDEVVLEGNLCDSRFLIEKHIDSVHGVIKIACGTTQPLETRDAFVPVVKIAYRVAPEVNNFELMFGQRTQFCEHDGFGTTAVLWLVDDVGRVST
jgi:hypothetical protein